MMVESTRNGAAFPPIPDWYSVVGNLVAVAQHLQDALGQIPDMDRYDLSSYYDDRGPDHTALVAARTATEALFTAGGLVPELERELQRAWSAIGHLGYHLDDSTNPRIKS